MSKGPDLSAFPIPRKGNARPLDHTAFADEAAARPPIPSEAPAAATPAILPPATPPAYPAEATAPATQATAPIGQMVATTVKLDEGRYLRLADAGKPGPGRLKRRTIQQMMVEALDEWFDRRGL